MKITLIRHGEGLDDIYSEIGGWSDRELSTSGVKTAFELAKHLAKTKEKYDLIYTSPLRRCQQTAEFVSHELKVRAEDLPYLKERNTYGLLSGVTRQVAQQTYPQLMAAYKKGGYIVGAERYPDFVERLGVLLDCLKNTNAKHLLCVTHGHVITAIIEEFVGQFRIARFGEICIVVLESGSDNRWRLVSSQGVPLGPKMTPGNEYKKFKK